MKQACLLAIALAGCPAAALAQGTFEYTFLEAIYQGNDQNDDDGYGIKGSFAFTDHWFVFGGYTRTSDGFGDASILGQNVPGSAYDWSEDYKRIGVGFHFALNARMDLVSRLMYDRADGELRYQSYRPGNLISQPGTLYYAYDVRGEFAQAEAGLRGRVLDAWELWGMAGYSHRLQADVSNVRVIDYTCSYTGCGLPPRYIERAVEDDAPSGGDPYARLGTLVRLTEHWGLTAEGRFSPGGVVSYSAGVRFTF